MAIEKIMIHNPIGVVALSKREILRFFTVASQTIFPPLISSTLFISIFGLAIGQKINFMVYHPGPYDHASYYELLREHLLIAFYCAVA